MGTSRIFDEALKGTTTHGRVIIATCGPKTLMNDVRVSAEAWRDGRNLSIDVHCKGFDF